MPGSDNNIQYAGGYRLEESSAESIFLMQKRATGVSCINYSGNPEGAVSANPASILYDRSTGNIYRKASGTGVTGWLIIGSGVITLNPDSGAPLLGTSFNVEGYLADTTQVMETYNDGGTFRIADQTFTTRYVVDASVTPGLKGTYTTIQSAINQAIADGWSTTTGLANILIRSGEYIEDLNIPALAAIHIYSLSPTGTNRNLYDVFLDGTITVNDTSAFFMTGILVNPVGTDAIITLGTPNACSVNDSYLISGSNSAVKVTGVADNISFKNCFIFGNLQFTNTSSATDINNCALFQDCEINAESTLAGTGKAKFYNCVLPQVRLSDTAAVAYYNCYCLGNITGAGTGACKAYDSYLLVSGIEGSFFDHAGTIRYSNCGVTSGGWLLSVNPTPLLDPSSQGNILNSYQTAISYDVLYTDYYIGVTSTAAARTIKLPNVSNISKGQVFIIKDESGAAGTNNITISTDGGNIDGAATALINVNYASMTIKSSGTAYFII